MPACAVRGCSSSSTSGNVSLFKFPDQLDLKAKWLKAINREGLKVDSHKVCELHFESDRVLRYATTSRLRFESVPTLKLEFTKNWHNDHSYSGNIQTPKKPKRKAEDHIPIFSEKVIVLAANSSSVVSEPTVYVETIDPVQHRFYEDYRCLKENCEILLSENRQLLDQLSREKVQRQNLERAKNEMEEQIAVLRAENKNLRAKLEEQNTLQGKFGKFFHEDQMRRIIDGGKTHWSNETIRDAIGLRYSCGSGYRTILQTGFPFPSESTLFRRTRSIRSTPGILYDVITMLKSKTDCLNIFERQAGILFDEMAVAPGCFYDKKLGSFTGHVTLPGHEGTATKALVFLLVGVSSRFKQVVAYHFAPSSTQGAVYDTILTELITLLEGINFNILFVTREFETILSLNFLLFYIIYKIKRIINLTALHKLSFSTPIPTLAINYISILPFLTKTNNNMYLLSCNLTEKVVRQQISFQILKNCGHHIE